MTKSISLELSNYYENKKILITGGDGFIGNNLIKMLSKCNADISAIDVDNKKINNFEKIKYYKCDIRNYSKLRALVRNISPEIVFHLAAFIDRDCNYEIIKRMIQVNLIGTVNIIESQQNNKSLQTIIIAGTCEEYGFQKYKYNEHLKENPVSPYSFSKVCNSYLCNMLIKNYPLPIVILRPSLAYGPGQKDSMFIPAMIRKLINNELFEMTSGEQTRDFIYISDLINAYLKAGFYKNIYGEIINIGYGKSYKIKYIAKLIAHHLKKKNLMAIGARNYRKSEIMSYEVDITKAKTLLYWKPEINIRSGILKTINSYK
jgi:UDP-glucose 4-epimerase